MGGMKFSTNILVLLSILLLAEIAWAEKPYDTQDKERYWSIFLRTKKDSPAEELAYARQLESDGRGRAARRRYAALVKHWPTAPEAATAQLGLARMLDEKGKLKDAFDEYQHLFDRYPSTFPVEEVLERQFDIAVEVMNAKKFKLIFGGLSDPEEAVPLFGKIVDNAPEWERAANAQYLIGRAYERAGKDELAIPAYQSVELRHRGNPLASEAAYRKCSLLFDLCKRHRNDARLRGKAYSELRLFLARYPESKHRDDVGGMKETLYERSAKAVYETAQYYEETAHSPEAALIQYRRLQRDYPESKWTDKAEERIVVLEPEVKDEA